ncbi:MAG: hypothetical protein L6Q51_11935 [Cyclobacteriaceae bacterium]|nr:hypothetical protein [Cyclobacteriaceae bacterium]
MKLIRTVKVGNITNLSDARYCAGMGVDMLGFTTIENQSGYVGPEAFQEFRGWFNGPAVVAEVYGLQDSKTLHEIMRNYLPDFIELGTVELPFVDLPSLALIVSTREMPSADNFLQQLARIHNQVAFILAEEEIKTSDLKLIADYYPVLLKLTKPVDEHMLTLPVKGFALKGNTEERPGLKSYDALATVLEYLAED